MTRRSIKTKKGKVTITGINFIASDSIVGYIREAFERFEKPEDIASFIKKNYGQIPRNVFMASVNPENPDNPVNEVVFTSF